MKRTVVLGTEIDAVSLEEAVDRAVEIMASRKGAYAVTPNSEMLLQARKDPVLAAALRRAALSLPDGVGVLLVSRILGCPIRERVCGIDFAWRLFEVMEAEGKSVFLLGAKDGIADRAAERLKRSYPRLQIAGTHSGYFDPGEELALLKQINAVSPDLLLVCLGSPKQELWMERVSSQLSVGLMAGLGGTLDVLAGTVRRAPESWQKCGMEWFFRLLCQPRRIVRVMRIPSLFLTAIRTKIGGNTEI